MLDYKGRSPPGRRLLVEDSAEPERALLELLFRHLHDATGLLLLMLGHSGLLSSLPLRPWPVISRRECALPSVLNEILLRISLELPQELPVR